MEYLFVYGTLRKGYNLKLKNRVSKEMRYIGKAKIAAVLYDLGQYPAVVKEKTNSEVTGDVFAIENREKVFAFLDEYEGAEFSRKKTRVRLRAGGWITAWVYWYNHRPEKKQRIFYKDYFNYLKNKSLL